MAVDEKVKEAEYFLERMKLTYPRDQFQFELSAFLSSSRSVVDYLLEEYNQKFNLGFALDDRLTIPIFKDAASQTSNSNATAFIDWYEPEVSRLANDPIGRIILSRRNMSIHRTRGPLGVHITLYETIHATESVSITKYDESMNLIGVSQSGPIESPASSSCPSETRWYFPENATDEISIVCERFLQLIKNLVARTRSRF